LGDIFFSRIVSFHFWQKCFEWHFILSRSCRSSRLVCKLAIRVTRWVCEKFAQNIAQTKICKNYCINLTAEESGPKWAKRATSLIFRKHSSSRRKFAQSGHTAGHEPTFVSSLIGGHPSALILSTKLCGARHSAETGLLVVVRSKKLHRFNVETKLLH
jgi:hypothetical protein